MTESETFTKLLALNHYRAPILKFTKTMSLDASQSDDLFCALERNPYVSELRFSEQPGFTAVMDSKPDGLRLRKLRVDYFKERLPISLQLLEKIVTISALTELQLHGIKFPQFGIETIANCPQLRVLSLKNT